MNLGLLVLNQFIAVLHSWDLNHTDSKNISLVPDLEEFELFKLRNYFMLSLGT
jgi:hypothetical protein